MARFFVRDFREFGVAIIEDEMARKLKKNLVMEKVLAGLREGNSLYAACVKAGISTRDFYAMLNEDAELRFSYQLALADYADQCTDEIKAITANLKAGEIDNSTAKLLIETSKWLAQKVCPEPFNGKAVEGAVDEDESAAEIVVKFV